MTNCAPFRDASKLGQAGDDDRTALAVRPGFYEAADLMKRIKMFGLGFCSVRTGSSPLPGPGYGHGPNKTHDGFHDDGRPPRGGNRRD